MDKLFPIEIFYVLFEYLPTLDLFRAFYGLNSRINKILSSIPIKLDKLYDIEIQQYVLPNICPGQVRTLEILYGGTQDILKLSEFINTQYLKIYLEPLLSQLHDIQHLSLLEKLFIERIHSQNSTEYKHLCKIIFSGNFSRLKYVTLPYIHTDHLRFVSNWSMTITYLKLVRCTKTACYTILENLHNLESCDVTISTDERQTMNSEHWNLKNFALITYDEENNLDMEELKNLCQCLPNIQCTNISIVYSGTVEDVFRELNQVLSVWKRLNEFNCYIKFLSSESNGSHIDEIKKHYDIFRNCEVLFYRTRFDCYCRIRKGFLIYI